MKKDSAAKHVEQQENQEGPEGPIVDKLSITVKDNDKGGSHKESDISRLKKRVNLWIALLPTIMFIVAAGQAAVAYYQLETNRTQFARDQRPYVISVAQPRPLVADQRILVDFRNGNYGKSPAIKVGGVGKVFFGNDALTQADRWFRDDAPKVFAQRNETIIPPHTPASNIEARWGTVTSDRLVSDADITVLTKQNFAIVAVMRQAYFDSTGTLYWTDSCVSNLAGGGTQMVIVECASHNEIH